MKIQTGQTMLIACGALARELKAIISLNDWTHLELHCLPAALHNRPDKIPAAIEALICSARAQDPDIPILVAYADCGTGGGLDAMLRRHAIDRLAGAHCYEFFTGEHNFAALHDQEPGTFYLTDFLARHFNRLIMEEMGINAHAELAEILFANYRRLVFLDQAGNPDLLRRARAAADALGLDFEHHPTGLTTLANELRTHLRLVPSDQLGA